MNNETKPSCDCGIKEARWRGDRYGLRMYLCDKCAKETFFIQSEQVRGEPRRYRIEMRGKSKFESLVTGCSSKSKAESALKELTN